MAAQQQPAIVLVQGAWQTPAHYADLRAQLSAAGFLVSHPALPTTNDARPATACKADDVALVRSELTRLADQGHPIIVLMHSYGGIVGSDAAVGLSWTARQRTHPRVGGGVVNMVWMVAFVVAPGEAIASPFNGEKPPWLVEDDANRIGWLMDSRNACYSDLLKEQQDYWLSKLVACPSSVVYDKVEHAPYLGENAIPATYITAQDDFTLTPAMQEVWATMLGPQTRREYVKSGHSPQLTCPGKIVEILNDVWKSVECQIRS